MKISITKTSLSIEIQNEELDTGGCHQVVSVIWSLDK